MGRGVGSGCTNGRGIPERDLDRAVVDALYDLISDEETTWALVTARAERWRREQDAKRNVDERPAIEREVEKLEAAIARLTDAIENGQPVGDRLKQRQAELDTLRAKLAEPESVDLDRDVLVSEVGQWIGPLVDRNNVVQTRQAMRHLGIEKIIVQPEADGGWSFSGVGDLTRLVGGRKGVGGSGGAPPRSSTVSGARSPRLKQHQLSTRFRLFRGRSETFELREGAKAVPDLPDLPLVVFDVLVGPRRVPLARQLRVLVDRDVRPTAGDVVGHLVAGLHRAS